MCRAHMLASNERATVGMGDGRLHSMITQLLDVEGRFKPGRSSHKPHTNLTQTSHIPSI
jgi:hypothetical protein